MGKILLFYKYITLENPEEIRDWQKELCGSLGLKGRILIATEGINATVGGQIQAVEEYLKAMKAHPLFFDVDYKESEGAADYFPRLRVVVRDEVVRLGIDPSLISAKDGGKHLSPTQAHELMAAKPKDLLIFDARNDYESRIGFFQDAVLPPIENFRDLPEYLDKNLDQFKDKEVLMYCTGGIRCERATALLKSKGVAKEVYQIEGGIHRYIEQFPDGFFRGKNYVFDGRISVKVNDDIFGSCLRCNKRYDEYTNCVNAMCNKKIIACPECLELLENTCSQKCLTLLSAGEVKKRALPAKVELKKSSCSF